MTRPPAGSGVPAAREEVDTWRGKPRSVVIEAEDRFASLPPLDQETGISFGWFDRMFLGWRDGMVFQYDDWKARDLVEMLKRDYKAKQIEAVLTYPTISAEHTTSPGKGDRGEYEMLSAYWEADPLNGGCVTPFDTILDQMTSAAIYAKSFHEIVWTRGKGDFAGKVVPKKFAWRPQTTSRVMRNPVNGDVLGFEQEPFNIGIGIQSGIYPIFVPRNRACIHIHGARRDPINGISDMEIPYWAYKTKQKILFLWFQFLEGVSLPLAIVKAQDPAVAANVARSLARARSRGVIPVGTDGRPDSVQVDTFDLSGKGAEQFKEAIAWLDSCAINAVLAGFLDLANAAANPRGVGSHALSSDASDFFLMTLESKNREIETSVRNEIFAPIIRYNFGPTGVIPKFKFEPLVAEDRSAALNMFNTLLTAYAQQPQLIPDELPMALGNKVGDFLGLDGDKISAAFEGIAKKAQEVAAQKSAAAASPAGQAVVGAAAKVSAATKMVKAAKAGKNPAKAVG